MCSLTAKGMGERRANQGGIWFENRLLRGNLRSLLWAASSRGMKEFMGS